MVKELQITTIVEDTAGGLGLLAEHGLALWIEADGRNLLFDTGQGMVLDHNAEALGIDLEKADSVILSHGHYDHTGGIVEASGRFHNATLYVHPEAFKAKYARRDDGTGQFASAQIASVDDAGSRFAKTVLTAGWTELADDIWVTGEIPRRTDFEDTGGPFYLDEACTVEDRLVDDQALYIESSQGVVVILGCAHAGLVNTLEYVAERTGCSRIHAVLGGTHLLRASQERLQKSIEALRRYDVQLIGPAHCTGMRAAAAIMNTWPERFVQLMTGSRVVISSGTST